MQRTLQALRSHVDWPKQEPEFRPRTLVSFWLSAVFSVFESRNIVLSCDVGRWGDGEYETFAPSLCSVSLSPVKMPGELLRAMAITDLRSTPATNAGTSKADLCLYLIVSSLPNSCHASFPDGILVK